MNAFPKKLSGLEKARLVNDYQRYVEIARKDEQVLAYCMEMLRARSREAFLCARIIQLLSDTDIKKLRPYAELLADLLKTEELLTSVKRTILRYFIREEIPYNKLSFIFDLCLKIFSDAKESIACRAFSIQILGKICEQESTLIHEATTRMKEHLPYLEGGVRNSAEHYLKKFSS